MKLKAIAVVLLFLLEFCVPSPTRPNVLRTEDPGWGVLGVQGAKDIATPNLGALARQGVLFTSGSWRPRAGKGPQSFTTFPCRVTLLQA